MFICVLILQGNLIQKQLPEVFYKKAVFTIFTGKHLVGVFFDRVASLKAFNFIKKRLQRRCFSVDVAKF